METPTEKPRKRQSVRKREAVLVHHLRPSAFFLVSIVFRVMADEIAENGHANGGEVPEIELIIKVSEAPSCVFGACPLCRGRGTIVPGRFSARPWLEKSPCLLLGAKVLNGIT